MAWRKSRIPTIWIVGLLAWILEIKLAEELFPGLRSNTPRLLARKWERHRDSRATQLYAGSSGQPQQYQEDRAKGPQPTEWPREEATALGAVSSRHERSLEARAGAFHARHGKDESRPRGGLTKPRRSASRADSSGSFGGSCTRVACARHKHRPSFRCLAGREQCRRCTCRATSGHGVQCRTPCWSSGTCLDYGPPDFTCRYGDDRCVTDLWGCHDVDCCWFWSSCPYPPRCLFGCGGPRPLFALSWTHRSSGDNSFYFAHSTGQAISGRPGGRQSCSNPCCSRCSSQACCCKSNGALRRYRSVMGGWSPQECRSSWTSSAHLHRRRRRAVCSPRPGRPRSCDSRCLRVFPLIRKVPKEGPCPQCPTALSSLRLMGFRRSESSCWQIHFGFRWLPRVSFQSRVGHCNFCTDLSDHVQILVRCDISYGAASLHFVRPPSNSSAWLPWSLASYTEPHLIALSPTAPWALVAASELRPSLYGCLLSPFTHIFLRSWPSFLWAHNVHPPPRGGPLVGFHAFCSTAPNRHIGGSGMSACCLTSFASAHSDSQFLQQCATPCTNSFVLHNAHGRHIVRPGQPTLGPVVVDSPVPQSSAPSQHSNAPNKHIGGSGMLACCVVELWQWACWVVHLGAFHTLHLAGPSCISFGMSLSFLLLMALWRELIRGFPCKKTRPKEVLALPSASIPRSVLLPLGQIGRTTSPASQGRRPRHRPAQRCIKLPWFLRCWVFLFGFCSVPFRVWAAPEGAIFLADISGQSPTPDPSLSGLRNLIAESQATSQPVSSAEAVSNSEPEEMPSAARREPSNIQADPAEDSAGRDQPLHDKPFNSSAGPESLFAAQPGVPMTVSVLIAAPGYSLETCSVNVHLPATVKQVEQATRAAMPQLLSEGRDLLIPSHPQLEFGKVSFVAVPSWFTAAKLVPVLIDARALDGSVFATVVPYPTDVAGISRAAGFSAVRPCDFFVSGCFTRIEPDEPVELPEGALIKILPPNSVPLWAPILVFSLWHPCMWTTPSPAVATGASYCVQLLHSSGKYLLSHREEDQWRQLNRVAQLIGVLLAEVRVVYADTTSFLPYVHRGTLVRGIVAVYPRTTDTDEEGTPSAICCLCRRSVDWSQF